MRKSIILVLLTCSCLLRGQGWTNLIDSIPWGLANFQSAQLDTLTNTLYIGGYFQNFNEFNTNSIIKYDGITFDTLQSGLDDQGSTVPVVKSMQMFQNKLYVFGNFFKTGRYWCNNIGRWNGASWDTVNFHPKNGTVWHSDVYNNELYVAGDFDTIGGIASNCISKFDGTNWYNIGHPVRPNIISAIKNFKGKLYMAGQVTPSSSSANLSYYDGSNWIPFVGVSGNNNKEIFGLTVIDSMLYVYGRFNSIAGTNCKGLAAFNGTNWYGFGDGLATSNWEAIENVQKINGKIYISGVFDTIESLSTSDLPAQLYTCLADFDGTKWCTFSPPFDNDVLGVVEYKNNLYTYGGFRKIGQDSVWGFVRWNGGNTTIACSPTLSITKGTVGIEEFISFDNLKIYPNPVKDKLNIEFVSFELSDVKLELCYSLGQVVSTLENPKKNQQIDLSDFSTGVYFLKIRTTSEQKVFKIIKQ